MATSTSEARRTLNAFLGTPKSVMSKLYACPRLPDASSPLVQLITLGESRVTERAIRAGWRSPYQIANVGKQPIARLSYSLYVGERDITTMTIGEIIQGIVGQPKILGACGRYQIVYVAFKELLNLGANKSWVFDVHTQDALGAMLMLFKRPVLACYMLGLGYDVHAAAADARAEWASLPGPDGRSHYSDGVNSASKAISYDNLLRAIDNMRTSYAQQLKRYDPVTAFWYAFKGTYSPK